MSDFDTWAKRPETHTSPELMGVRCNNCPALSAREVDKAKLHRWKYYCEARHVNMELKDMYAVSRAECPLHRELKRGRKGSR